RHGRIQRGHRVLQDHRDPRAAELAHLLGRSEEHTSELQSPDHLVCRLLLEKKKNDDRPKTNDRRDGRAIGRRPITSAAQATCRAPALLQHPLQPRDSPAATLSFLALGYRASLFLLMATATPDIYTLSLHDALPISVMAGFSEAIGSCRIIAIREPRSWRISSGDRKSTRLNSSHQIISYAVFCLKKKKTMTAPKPTTAGTDERLAGGP